MSELTGEPEFQVRRERIGCSRKWAITITRRGRVMKSLVVETTAAGARFEARRMVRALQKKMT